MPLRCVQCCSWCWWGSEQSYSDNGYGEQLLAEVVGLVMVLADTALCVRSSMA